MEYYKNGDEELVSNIIKETIKTLVGDISYLAKLRRLRRKVAKKDCPD